MGKCSVMLLAWGLAGTGTFVEAQSPPSFPGAEGFGSGATGGRGGRVIYVTNLGANGPGSLQAALDETGPRYILFRVSGLIDADVQLTTDDVTIAGQTSPGGIIVRGFHTTEEPYCDQDPVCIGTARTAQNWILRHIRTRPAGGGLDDGLRLLHTRNAVIDHVSIANASDEAVQISFSHDITLQNSLISETLGEHANLGGMLMNYSDPSVGWELSRLSIHHNTWNRIVGRMPEISRESTAAAWSVMDLELSNNLLWDPGYFIDVTRETFPYGPNPSAPVYYRFNWVGNQSFARPGFPFGAISFPDPLPGGTTATYFSDNRLNLYPDRSDYQLNYCCNDYPDTTPPAGTPPYAIPARHAFPVITYMPAAGLRDTMLANVGAFPRDPMDRRLMNPVQTGVFDPAPRDANPYGDAHLFDFPAGSPPQAPADTDNDGMPDEWEVAHGLNPGVQDHNGTELSVSMTGVAGYTNLECYLNELAQLRVGARFLDVPPSHAFYGFIDVIARLGITQGCSVNPPLYCPDRAVTRAQMAAFVLRGEHGGTHVPPPATGIFSDVPPADPFAPWIEEIYAEGITQGCGTNPLRYCPQSPITRGQMAVFLLRAEHGSGYVPPPATGIFEDVPRGHPFEAWIERLYGEGITRGCATNPLRYCPESAVTRGQMAPFLVRTFQLS